MAVVREDRPVIEATGRCHPLTVVHDPGSFEATMGEILHRVRDTVADRGLPPPDDQLVEVRDEPHVLWPPNHQYEAYTPGKVLFYLQLLMFSGLAVFLLLPLMKRTEAATTLTLTGTALLSSRVLAERRRIQPHLVGAIVWRSNVVDGVQQRASKRCADKGGRANHGTAR